MIQVSNTTAQTLQPGQTLTFDRVFRTKNGCECFSEQIPNSVKLCGRGIYEVQYVGNASGAAGAQLALAIAGVPIVTTAMNFTTADGDLANISTATFLKNCCCDADRISVMNTGTVPVTIAPNTSLMTKRFS